LRSTGCYGEASKRQRIQLQGEELPIGTIAKRIGRAWRALGRVRQTALLLLGLLTLLQATLLVTTGRSIWLPLTGMVALLGVFLIKLSASTRDSGARLIGVRREMTRTRKAVQHELETHKRTQRTSADAVALAWDQLRLIREQLGSTREQVGRTGAQFEWLSERALADSARLNALTDSTDSVLERLRTQEQSRVDSHLEITTSIAAHAAAIAEVETVARTQLAALAEVRKAGVAHASAIEASASAAAEASESAAADTSKGFQEATQASAELARSVRSINTKLVAALDGGNSHSLERRIIAEVSALVALHDSSDAGRLPVFASWAMSPLAVHYINSVAARLDSRSMVLELGSGISTAWIAYGLSRVEDPARLVAIDHDPKYAAITRQYLMDLDTDTGAEVILAPLAPVQVDGSTREWYSTDWVSDINEVGLLIVDGPPAGENPDARYPALPLLLDRLADQATIFIDDAERPGEAGVVDAWLALPGVSRGSFIGRSLVLNFSRIGDVK